MLDIEGTKTIRCFVNILAKVFLLHHPVIMLTLFCDR